MKFMTLIYDSMNILVRIEERTKLKDAEKAGQFWTKTRSWWWYRITLPKDENERQIYYAMLNF